MKFTEGDFVKYNFPDPIVSGKEFILGQIFFVGNLKVSVRCDDNSILNISFKNFERIELLNTNNSAKHLVTEQI
jgi:hypothetical protein